MHRIFIDENALLCVNYFKEKGYDVGYVRNEEKGMDDNDVFYRCIEEQRILVTHNGKHFIIYVPPKVLGVAHKGIIWLKSQMTGKNYLQMCDKIHIFLNNTSNIDGTILEVKKKNTDVIVVERYSEAKRVLN